MSLDAKPPRSAADSGAAPRQRAGAAQTPSPAISPADPALARPAGRGWARVGGEVVRRVFEHRLLATSGGVAFFALMAIFPALATIVSLYSLFADPQAIPQRLALLAGVVPTSVIDLLKQEIQHLVAINVSTLSTAFGVGLLVSLWSANSGVSALFDALNVVHAVPERRSLVRFYATTFAVTLGAVVLGLAFVIGVLPIIFRGFGLARQRRDARRHPPLARLLIAVMVGLSVVYRVGPSRSEAKWRWVTWGSGLAGLRSFYPNRCPKY